MLKFVCYLLCIQIKCFRTQNYLMLAVMYEAKMRRENKSNILAKLSMAGCKGKVKYFLTVLKFLSSRSTGFSGNLFV